MTGIESPFLYLGVEVDGNEMGSRELIPLIPFKSQIFIPPKIGRNERK